MSTAQQKRRNQVKLARLEILSKMFLRGHSVREIRAEVIKRLNLRTYSLSTVHRDIQSLLEELKQDRLDNAESALNLELARIDATCEELWEQWEKSKEDYIRTYSSRRGAPTTDSKTGESHIKTYGVTSSETNVVGLGNPAYIAEIRQQLAERRKLLGLYAADKKDISGNVSFASLLVESGMLDEAEQAISAQNGQQG
jgi:hypothetical protein